jgi:BirA family biotin operon repressor/biotin-[acetyl-CoA-carboxylase] ligase
MYYNNHTDLMMNEELLRTALIGLPVPRVVYYSETGSTNDIAQALLEQDAPDGTLVAADSQTKGRGRLGRHWVTTPGTALAFTLALRSPAAERERLAFFSPLAGLAVCQALVEDYGLPAEVKWPNDVLLSRRKVCGVLVEAAWMGDRLEGVVVGIGVNVAPSSVPPDEEVLFPATCVEQALGRPVDRVELLARIIRRFFELRPEMGSPSFLQLWQDRLAFRGEMVQVDPVSGDSISGRVVGIDPNGHLRLRKQDGEEINVAVGDVRLRAKLYPAG